MLHPQDSALQERVSVKERITTALPEGMNTGESGFHFSFSAVRPLPVCVNYHPADLTSGFVGRTETQSHTVEEVGLAKMLGNEKNTVTQ